MEFLTRVDLGDSLEENLENKISDLLDNKLIRNDYIISYLEPGSKYTKTRIVKASSSDNAKRFFSAVHGDDIKILDVSCAKLFY